MKKMKLKNKKNQQQGHEKRTGKKLQKRVQLKCYLFSCKTFIDTFIKWKNPLFSHHFTFATITHAGTPATTLAYNMYVYIRLMFFLSFFPSFILWFILLLFSVFFFTFSLLQKVKRRQFWTLNVSVLDSRIERKKILWRRKKKPRKAFVLLCVVRNVIIEFTLTPWRLP